jgi:SAM-dependent methyltransferase
MMADMGDAAARWRDQLAQWAIPAEILAGADESPWAVPTQVFVRRADASVRRPMGNSYRRASEASGEDGTVLDVGSGAGAASLPLGRPIVAVDTSAELLAALTDRAQGLGLPVQAIQGRWPDVADRTPAADVVVCHHAAYNAPELDVFCAALTDHARRRVVLELTANHPMTPLNPLWTRLYALPRPDRPTADDAVAVLREIGITPTVEVGPHPPRGEYKDLADLVAVTRRRLCLTPDRDDDLRDALLHLGVDPFHPADLAPTPDTLITLWWNT